MLDQKIKKYAQRCKITAWILMIGGIGIWLGKWTMDWELNWFLYYWPNNGATNLNSLPSETIKYLDRILNADYSGAWIGIENLAKLSSTSRFLCFLFDGIATGILAIGFWFFIKLMGELKKGSVFSNEVIEILNKLAKAVFWFAIYTPINRAIIGLIATFQNPPGQRYLVATINFSDVFILAASWFFVILTSLMHESQQLQAERDLTI